jgi:hypothetical protein
VNLLTKVDQEVSLALVKQVCSLLVLSLSHHPLVTHTFSVLATGAAG